MQENFQAKLESIFSEAKPRKMLFMALGAFLESKGEFLAKSKTHESQSQKY